MKLLTKFSKKTKTKITADVPIFDIIIFHQVVLSYSLEELRESNKLISENATEKSKTH